MSFIVGNTYAINHTRKGLFIVTVTGVGDVWLTGTLVSGTPRMMNSANEHEVGEEMFIRLSMINGSQLLESAQ